MTSLIASILLALEELASRGFNHPEAARIVGGIRVSLDQLAASAGAPPPPADPVDQQLAQLNLSVAALGEAVERWSGNSTQVIGELAILSGQVAHFTEALATLAASTQALAAPAPASIPR